MISIIVSIVTNLTDDADRPTRTQRALYPLTIAFMESWGRKEGGREGSRGGRDRGGGGEREGGGGWGGGGEGREGRGTKILIGSPTSVSHVPCQPCFTFSLYLRHYWNKRERHCIR